MEESKKCDFCQGGKPLVTGETSDYGISINHISYIGPCLHAYGYDVHGTGSNGLTVKINYCPMCGKLLNE